MPPEIVGMLEALPLAALLLLLMPKRAVGLVRVRLGHLSAGRRRWLFEPPRGWGATRTSARQRVLAEALRAFEIGVPLYVVARFAEERAAHAKLEARERWANSQEALFGRHVVGKLSEAELAAQLLSRGLPLPAKKAVAPKVEPYRLASLDWWLKVQALAEERARTTSIANGDAVGPPEAAPDDAAEEAIGADELDESAIPAPPSMPAEPPTYLGISIVGRIEIRHDGKDLVSELLRKPVLAFMWLYLLVRWLTASKDRMPRPDFAEELTPGMSREKQGTRLRNRLSNIGNGALPASLATRVDDDGESVKLDLSGCSIDLLRLEELAAECLAKEGMLSLELAADAARLLDATAGELLPGWEQLENSVTGGRGAAGVFVRALRVRAESARITLMGALAANHLARQQPGQAIPLLEQALERQPDRDDLARKLRMAYLQTDQLTRAAELQKTYDLDG